MTNEPKHGLKRYRLSHNRDFMPIMTEALESQFIRIPELEWVKASDHDALIAAKDAEIAGVRLDAERYRWLKASDENIAKLVMCNGDECEWRTIHACIDEDVDAARSKQEGA